MEVVSVCGSILFERCRQGKEGIGIVQSPLCAASSESDGTLRKMALL